MKPPVQLRLGPRAFSRDFTEDSDIPLYCEKKTSLHSSHCNEIQLSFESGNLGFHCIGSSIIPHSPSYRTSGLTSLRQLQRFPETLISSLKAQQFQHRISNKAPCTPYRLEKRDDSQDSTKEVGHLPTSTSRGAFLQQWVCERDPEFAASCAVDTEIP